MSTTNQKLDGTDSTPTPSGSPIAKAAEQATEKPLVQSATEGELYTEVNEATDTVYGQMQNKWLNPNDPLMKRVASQANERSAARGLTNSSIAQGNALGAVVDKAGQFATADAGFYNDRKTENQRSATHITSTKMNNDTQIEATQIGADAQIESSNISARAQVASAGISARARVQTQKLSDEAAMARLEVDTASRESINAAELAARSEDQAKELASRERQTQINADNQWAIAEYQQRSQDNRQEAELYADVFRDYNTAVMNIDQNANAASQREQLQRVNDAMQIRLEAQGYIDKAVNVTSPVQPGQGLFTGNNSFGGGSMPIGNLGR